MTEERTVSLALLPEAIAAGWHEVDRVACQHCTGRRCLRCAGAGVLAVVRRETREPDPRQGRLW